METQENLAKLPIPQKGEPVTAIWKLLANFKKDVAQLVNGKPDDGEAGLVQKIRSARQTFRKAIVQQAPNFKPFNRPPSPISIAEPHESPIYTEEEIYKPSEFMGFRLHSPSPPPRKSKKGKKVDSKAYEEENEDYPSPTRVNNLPVLPVDSEDDLNEEDFGSSSTVVYIDEVLAHAKWYVKCV